MFGLIVKIKCVLLKKALVADLTHMTEFFLMALHVIEHGGLILFCDVARRAHKESLFVLNIGKRHSWTCSDGQG